MIATRKKARNIERLKALAMAAGFLIIMGYVGHTDIEDKIILSQYSHDTSK